MAPHFIKTQPFRLIAPNIALQERVEFFGGIAKASEVFAQGNDDIRAFFSRVRNKLQLVETTPTGLIVTCHDDVLLLHGKRNVTQLGVSPFENSSIEAVVVLLQIS